MRRKIKVLQKNSDGISGSIRMKEIKTENKLHVFVCVNERINKDSCSHTISQKDFYELKKWAKEEGLIPNIFITKTGCLGFCNPIGGCIAIYPNKKFYSEIKSIDEIKEIIRKFSKENLENTLEMKV